MGNPIVKPPPISRRVDAEDIDAYLVQHQHKSLLRFINLRSVGSANRRLIGRTVV